MKLFIKFDINTICSLYLKQNLEENNVNFTTLGFGEIEIEDNMDAEALENLKTKLGLFKILITHSYRHTVLELADHRVDI